MDGWDAVNPVLWPGHAPLNWFREREACCKASVCLALAQGLAVYGSPEALSLSELCCWCLLLFLRLLTLFVWHLNSKLAAVKCCTLPSLSHAVVLSLSSLFRFTSWTCIDVNLLPNVQVNGSQGVMGEGVKGGLPPPMRPPLRPRYR